MSGLPAVQAAATEPMSSVALTPATPTREVALTSERNLFEFIAQQSQANSLGKAGTLANPGALATEASRHLRGYMERGNQTTSTREKGRTMGLDENGARTPSTPTDGPTLHPGPARDNLAPSGTGGRTEAVGQISENTYNEIIDRLTASMHLTVESTAVITGVGNVQHSFQSLMKGQ